MSLRFLQAGLVLSENYKKNNLVLSKCYFGYSQIDETFKSDNQKYCLSEFEPHLQKH